MPSLKPSSLFNIGTDIIEIKRIRQAAIKHGSRFLDRVFTQKEQSYCFNFSNPYPSLAARFAAKEAVAKALGCGIGKSLQWKNIEITRQVGAKPQVTLSQEIMQKFQIQSISLSMSHCKEYAMATVLLAVSYTHAT